MGRIAVLPFSICKEMGRIVVMLKGRIVVILAGFLLPWKLRGARIVVTLEGRIVVTLEGFLLAWKLGSGAPLFLGSSTHLLLLREIVFWMRFLRRMIAPLLKTLLSVCVIQARLWVVPSHYL
jgi:hypothetical protein